MGTEQSVFQEIGVVEGFYGRVWQPAERRAFIASLLPFGLNTYLYCPKHEPALAAEVLRPLNGEEAGHLGELATFCAGRGVALWVGLHLEPPLNVNNAAHLEAVAAKCHGLWKLGVKGFCIQFDDLSGAFDPADSFAGSLAALQAHAVEGIYRQAAALVVQAPGLWFRPSTPPIHCWRKPTGLLRLTTWRGWTSPCPRKWRGCTPGPASVHPR